MSIDNDLLVSVVIPCYNLGLYLEEAINSVKKQSYKNYEIIIVDDGSTDIETKKKVVNIKDNSQDINVIIQKNQGLSEARNTGVKAAKGKYIICLDADDMLDSEYINKVMSVFIANRQKDIYFVTTWVQEFGKRTNMWKTMNYNPELLLTENVIHAGSMFKKEAWEKIGGYKKEMQGGYEDWEFWISLVEINCKWGIVKEPLFLYRIRDNSMLLSANARHMNLYGRIVELHLGLFAKYSKELALVTAKKIKEMRKIIEVNSRLVADNNAIIEIDRLKFLVSNKEIVRLNKVIILEHRALVKLGEDNIKSTTEFKKEISRLNKVIISEHSYLLKLEDNLSKVTNLHH